MTRGKGNTASTPLTLEDLDATLRTVLQSINFQSEKFDTMLAGQQELKNSLKSTMDDVVKLKSGFQELHTSNILLTEKIHHLEQNAISNCLEIVGLTDNLLDKPDQTVTTILQTLKCENLSPVRCTKRKTNKSVSLVVEFKSKDERDSIIQQKKEHGPLQLGSDQVMVRELLTPHTRELLWLCNSQKSTLQYKFVWIKNGCVLMKKDETKESKVIQIRSKNDIPSS